MASRNRRAVAVILMVLMSSAFAGCDAAKQPGSPSSAPSSQASTGSTTPATDTSVTDASGAGEQSDMVGTLFSSSAAPPASGDDTPGVKYSYRLAQGADFTGYYLVDNARPLAHGYALLVFVDYRQVPFRLDGSLGLTHVLRMDAGEHAYWPIDIGPLPSGSHTLSTILVWDPDYHSMDAEFRQASEWGMLSANQASLLVGKKKAFAKVASLRPSGSVDASVSGPFDGVRINQLDRALDSWTGAGVGPGEAVTYYIHVGNITNRTARYSLIALFDYVQVPIGAGAGPTIVSVPPHTTLTYRASVRAPDTPGVHELMVVRGVMPLTTIAGEGDMIMQGSGRVPITVR
jgi:hypothetical protein